MAKMGYKEGTGLGKYDQGRVNIVEASKQRGKRGLGLRLKGLEPEDIEFKEEKEIKLQVKIEWIPKSDYDLPPYEEMKEWYGMGKRKEFIDDETEFCDTEILTEMLKSKSMFDELGHEEFWKARTRSNPYETIRGAIFQNRAAMKMAEIDFTFDFMFTQAHLSPSNPSTSSSSSTHGSSPQQLLYFADICAGPGGFSEYILWRCKWRSKGFGLTLRADWANDFKLDSFLAGTPETFEPYYGVGGYDGDGDIFREDNLLEFKRYVMEQSENKGVHVVMADGGFSVEGQENIQEVLSKQLYLCQFVCAISILRPGGHFLCKVFDLFTPFSVGLVYLLYKAFKDVCIMKPLTSRPANSERYLVCRGKHDNTEDIERYMMDINRIINKNKGSQDDILTTVPLEIICADSDFLSYVTESNNRIGSEQVNSLQKLRIFVKNLNLPGPNQGVIRKQLLQQWQVPGDARSKPRRGNPNDQYRYLMEQTPISNLQVDTTVLDQSTFASHVPTSHSFKCMVESGEPIMLLSLGLFHIFEWDLIRNPSFPQWRKLHGINIELPKDTLIEVELVTELVGEGKGQRRFPSIHIIDGLFINGDYIGDKPISERWKILNLFVQAISKPSRRDLAIIRVKEPFHLRGINNVLSKLSVKEMKRSRDFRLSLPIDGNRYVTPRGVYLLRTVRDPWVLVMSKSQNRAYFFNKKTGATTYDFPGQESVADYKFCSENRLLWQWHNKLSASIDLIPIDGHNGFSKQSFLNCVHAAMDLK